MTSVMNGRIVFTYDEWIKNKKINNVQESPAKCAMCDGDGEHECECGDTHTCESCNGTGEMENQHKVYELALREEIQRLNAWIDGDKTIHPTIDKTEGLCGCRLCQN
jgi:DnaJ-class molecular chaperone